MERKVKQLLVTVSEELKLGTYMVCYVLEELCKMGLISREERIKIQVTSERE